MMEYWKTNDMIFKTNLMIYELFYIRDINAKNIRTKLCLKTNY